MPNDSRSLSSCAWAKNKEEIPLSSSASNNVMVANEASIVQYGAGHSSTDSPSPVDALSGSEYRARYACGSASTSATSGALIKVGKEKDSRFSTGNAMSQYRLVSSPVTTRRDQP